jgi:hypothetical protein
MGKHDPFDILSERQMRDYYDVGYGKPPKSTRFQPGQSGNPSGRSKVRASYAALTRRELDKTITLGRGDKSVTMTKRQVIAARFRQAIKAGDVEAFKLAMLIDQDPASDEPIDQEKESKLFWKRARKELEREFEREEEQERRRNAPARPEKSSSTQPSDADGPSSDDPVAPDLNEIPDEERGDEQA